MSHFEPSASYTVFLRRLVRVRIDSGTTPTELSERLGLPVEIVREIEAGKRPLDFVQTRTWCLALGVDFTQFVFQVGKDMEANFVQVEPQPADPEQAHSPDAIGGDDGEGQDQADPLFAEFDDLEGGAR